MDITRTIPALSLFSVSMLANTPSMIDFNQHWLTGESKTVIDYMLDNGLLTYEIVINPSNIADLLDDSSFKTALINFFSEDDFPNYAVQITTSVIINLIVTPASTSFSIYFESLCSAADWTPTTYSCFDSNYAITRIVL